MGNYELRMAEPDEKSNHIKLVYILLFFIKK